jgi:acetylglutamate kinase
MNVIKLGGSLLDDPVRRAEALNAIAAQWKSGEEIVLVHGGGKHVDANLKRLGIPKRTYAGLRVTDDETLDVVVATLAGSVNKMLVAELAAIGVRSAGISDFGNVGSVIGGDPTLLRAIVSYGILPVVSSVAEGPNGTLLNVNADSAAAAIAVSLGAEELIFITDVAGLLDARGNVVAQLHADEAEALLGTSVVTGGMRPKLQAALHALGSGVRRITIGEEGGTNLVAA